MSRLRRSIRLTLSVIKRMGTQERQVWPIDAWVYVRTGHRRREGYWFQNKGNEIRASNHFSEIEANILKIYKEDYTTPISGTYTYNVSYSYSGLSIQSPSNCVVTIPIGYTVDETIIV